MFATITASLLWGVTATITAADRASAAHDIVSVTGPLSFYSQRIYQLLADADATEATAFLAVTEPPAASAEFRTDIERTDAYLQAVTSAGPPPAARSDLATLASEIPEYTQLIGQARADNLDGLPVGASYLQEASYLMRTRLLPAAGDLYRQENTRLTASYSRATQFPVIALIVAVICAFTLFRVQRRLTSRTHRRLNLGLGVTSLVGLASLAWLLAAFFSAQGSLDTARQQGTAAAQPLVQAEITGLRAHADESLTLINRSGDDASEADFKLAEKQLGSLVSEAKAAGTGSPGYVQVIEARSTAAIWFAVHRAVRDLDNGGDYPDAVYLAIGSGPAASPDIIRQQEAALTRQGFGDPASSTAAYQALAADLNKGIDADQALFTTSATHGDGALGGLTAAMIIASALMAVGCVWGLTRRLAEYR
jgi:hypothetical protein